MYRLLDHFWHEPHSHRMNVLPVRRDFLWHDGWPKWDERKRPFPPCDVVDHYTPGVYDAVICHVDEVCWRYHNMAPQFRELRRVVKDAPIIVINHGTPDDETDALMMRDWLDGCHMVVNSEQAARDWGWGTPIIHGYDASEWVPRHIHMAPMAVTTIGGPSVWHDSYNGWPFMEQLKLDYPIVTIGQDVKCGSFDEYRRVLGEGTIYVNTTARSPMPGARTEAMLLGLCVVTFDNHDADRYFADGVTGLVAHDEAEFRAKLEYALANPKEAQRIGRNGAIAARQHFAVDRYVRDWMRLLKDVCGRSIDDTDRDNESWHHSDYGELYYDYGEDEHDYATP